MIRPPVSGQHRGKEGQSIVVADSHLLVIPLHQRCFVLRQAGVGIVSTTIANILLYEHFRHS